MTQCMSCGDDFSPAFGTCEACGGDGEFKRPPVVEVGHELNRISAINEIRVRNSFSRGLGVGVIAGGCVVIALCILEAILPH